MVLLTNSDQCVCRGAALRLPREKTVGDVVLVDIADVSHLFPARSAATVVRLAPRTLPTSRLQSLLLVFVERDEQAQSR
jgi:hypothetical protein